MVARIAGEEWLSRDVAILDTNNHIQYRSSDIRSTSEVEK